jgi:hypothetical protein
VTWTPFCGIISKTNIARFEKKNIRKYLISAPISLGYAPFFGENYKLAIE